MVTEWLPLQRGDSVALIAPASGQKNGEDVLVEQALELLSTWGLNVVLTPRLSAQRYLSANDACRAQDVTEALTHPHVKAVFMTRGGYGCARLLPYIADVSLPTPRYVVGFSDITTLHLHGVQQANWQAVHAPNLATQQFLADTPAASRNREALYQALFHQQYPRFDLQPINSAGIVQQRGGSMDCCMHAKVGGCLSLLVTSLGTAHELDSADKVLMIEEVGEAPYKIDRMLTHLRNAGIFQRPKAVIFGEMCGCDSPHIALSEVLAAEFADDDFPVFSTPSFGHGEVNVPWVYD